MVDTTPNCAFPLLTAGQAQKEVLHNEALALLDALVAPCVESAGDNTPPPAPIVGQAWIVGAAPTGAWAAQPETLASWGEGGWRFIVATEGLCIWRRDHARWIIRHGGVWDETSFPVPALAVNGTIVVGAQQPAIPDPAGGVTVDVEARATVATVLGALRAHGLIVT